MTTVANLSGFRTQRLTLSTGERTWTVLGRDHRVVEPAEEYLEYLRTQKVSPNTVKSYGRALALWWQYLDVFGLAWDAVTLEDFGAFLTWLRTGEARRSRRSIRGRRGSRSRRSRCACGPCSPATPTTSSTG
ncbi:site-specific integrase [Streptomyces sp. NPDC058442]|uniref:site-specific integrase n=1 Tax=Streptomyces sp. NPDC058442 TaxID=3346503 RepID=UPI003647C3EA